ncbi:hypothetical protein AERO8C_160291 [Aeromonas veronii]|uniref:Uncharacterized protein n=1 Tax=Aeromonas veronii TaxID=654 RepID=A0A653KZG1_AERVE|nr:hypothetical protein AERO8C_160291 [Aeromonas veronii]
MLIYAFETDKAVIVLGFQPKIAMHTIDGDKGAYFFYAKFQGQSLFAAHHQPSGMALIHQHHLVTAQ